MCAGRDRLSATGKAIPEKIMRVDGTDAIRHFNVMNIEGSGVPLSPLLLMNISFIFLERKGSIAAIMINARGIEC